MGKRDRSTEPKKLGRKPVELQFDLKVEFVPVAEEHEAAYRKALKILLQWLYEARDEYEQELKTKNEDK